MGVDGGNSGTRALILDAAAQVRGYGESGNANHQGQGMDQAVQHIGEAVQAACRTAGCRPQDLTHVYFALAGTDTEDDAQALLPALLPVIDTAPYSLANDVWAGLRAGSTTGTGVAVNCGSGTGVVGTNRAGDRVMIVDVGYILGSSGGGMQLAVDAVRAVIRAWDGRDEPTVLTDLILSLTGMPDVYALYMAIYRGTLPRQALRGVTRLVFQAAARGDAVAQRMLERLGEEIGLAGAAVARRLHLQDEPFTFVLTGGTMRSLRTPLARAAIARMRQTAPAAQPVLPRVLPVGGAALLALDAAGAAVSEAHYERLVTQGYGWHPEERFAAQ